jgi:hypothetical protein
MGGTMNNLDLIGNYGEECEEKPKNQHFCFKFETQSLISLRVGGIGKSQSAKENNSFTEGVQFYS